MTTGKTIDLTRWTFVDYNAKELTLLNYDVEEDSRESLGLQGDLTNPS